MKGKISMIQILIDEINRMMTVFSARLDIANDNAKWYSTFALAECAGIASYLKTEDSLPLQTSLVLLGISLLWFICSVYINFGIRRIMMEQSAQAISQFSDLKGPLEIEISDAAEKDALKKQIHKIIKRWRAGYTGNKKWDTERFNILGLAFFGLGTACACIGILSR